MRTSRRLSPALPLALLLSAACARCGAGPHPPPPVERFVARDAAAVLVVPSLEGFARQGSGILAAAAGLPFGAALLHGRSVVAGGLTVDPLDAAAVAGAGLDPGGGLALAGRVGARGPGSPDVVLTLPVGDPARLEATLTRIARDRLAATERTVEEGRPRVTAWRKSAGGPIALAWAIEERTAILSAGTDAVAAIRGAAAVPPDATLGQDPAYQRAMRALGGGHAMAVWAPAGSPALAELPQLENGVAVALKGDRDRVAVTVAVVLGDREAALQAAIAEGRSGALMAGLDPSALLVARGDGGAGPADDDPDLFPLLVRGVPGAPSLLTDLVQSLGGSSALSLGLVPPGRKPPLLQEAPLRFVRAELLVALRDPARMTRAIQQAIDHLAPSVKGGALRPLGRNPWRLPVGGGEVAAAVTDGRLALAAGPAKTLEALLARSGTSFKGPTAASEAALRAPAGGMFLDVPRLVAAVRTLPEEAYGDGTGGVAMKSMVDQWARSAERIAAISVASDRVEGHARGELLIELAPHAAPPAAR